MSILITAVYIASLALGLGALAVGAYASVISASANMSFKNSLPRAGCAFFIAGVALCALGVWGLRP